MGLKEENCGHEKFTSIALKIAFQFKETPSEVTYSPTSCSSYTSTKEKQAEAVMPSPLPAQCHIASFMAELCWEHVSLEF